MDLYREEKPHLSMEKKKREREKKNILIRQFFPKNKNSKSFPFFLFFNNVFQNDTTLL